MNLRTVVLCALTLAFVLSPAVFAEEAETAAKTEAKKVIVDLVTDKGTITVELWPDKAPKTVDNFVDYVERGHFDGTIFHRVVKGFVIQGGGYLPNLTEKPTAPPIPLEAKESNRKYTIAMARTTDPNSARAQFYINLSDNVGLDPERLPPGYAVFGKVVKGTGVVDQIAGLPRDDRGEAFTHLTSPVVVIQKATVAK